MLYVLCNQRNLEYKFFSTLLNNNKGQIISKVWNYTFLPILKIVLYYLFISIIRLVFREKRSPIF